MFTRKLLISAAALLLFAGCKEESKLPEKTAENKRLLIYTSIQPIAFISSKIAGKYAEVKALIPPGKSPHSFTLVPGDLKKMSKAKFFFSVRLPFEEFKLEKAFKDSSTEWVNVAKGVRFYPLDESGHEHGEHAHDHDHEHEKHDQAVELMDPHIWLDPANDLIIARNVCNTLSKAMPEQAAYFALNYKNFERCITALDKKLAKLLAPFKGEIFLVYHPAFGYFARHYGLKQEAVEAGGKDPSPKHLQKVINLARQKNVRIVFVQPEFNRKAARLIAKTIEGTVIKLDPLAYNLVDNYTTFATKIQAAIKSREKADNAKK
ncbi:MAG: zinc ABC transporter substrate-binding protein [Victivallaceae bacterium]|nr:zinc ABC transporter substrate-binding protein [Victivallaceae bacterium]